MAAFGDNAVVFFEKKMSPNIPSGNQTWQWKMDHRWFSYEPPPLIGDFPLPCLMTPEGTNSNIIHISIDNPLIIQRVFVSHGSHLKVNNRHTNNSDARVLWWPASPHRPQWHGIFHRRLLGSASGLWAKVMFFFGGGIDIYRYLYFFLRISGPIAS